jgi:hypothetical protein
MVQDGKPQQLLGPADLRSSLLQGSNEPHDKQDASNSPVVSWFSAEHEDDGLALPSSHSK